MANGIIIEKFEFILYVGYFLIIIGFVSFIFERVNKVPLFYGKDQVNGVLNSYAPLGVGIALISSNIKSAVIHLTEVILVMILIWHAVSFYAKTKSKS